MGHTQAKDLEDLSHELNTIRLLDGLKEKKPGIFYYKSTAFLHFHDQDGRRWADVKVDGDWASLAIDFEPGISERRAFMSSVKKAHKKLNGK